MERDPAPVGGGSPSPDDEGAEPSADLLAAVEALRAVITAGDQYRLQAATFFGLGISDTYAISNLHLHGAMTQGELGRRIGVSTSGVTGLVDRLERAEIARRTRDSGDRRRSIVELTEAGRAVMNHSRSRLLRVFDDVDPDALPRVTSRLHAVADQLIAQANGLEADLSDGRIAGSSADHAAGRPATRRNVR